MSEQNVSEETIQAVGEALMLGKKIEAIKIYREATGVDLKEAKEFIEKLGDKLAAENPEKFAKAESGSGCAGVIFLALTLGGGLVMTLLQNLA
jgi:ribosomal protein L7/L12